MSIIKLESKNIRTLAVMTLVGSIGAALFSWFTNAGYLSQSFDKGSVANPYIGAFQPILFFALPLLLLASFIFGIVSSAREESSTARWQAALLTVIVMVLGYIVSFMLISQDI